MFHDLIVKNRSYRRFDQNVPLNAQTLRELVDLARLSASGANLQPLKYILATQPSLNAKIYDTLVWAGYLKNWPGPDPDERPTGYIIILNDTRISKSCGCDHGIAAQSILLGAVEKGLGGCMVGSIQRQQLAQVLNLSADFEIVLAIALGKPVEQVVLEDIDADASIEYYRDQNQIHHVPKRRLDDIILKID